MKYTRTAYRITTAPCDCGCGATNVVINLKHDSGETFKISVDVQSAVEFSLAIQQGARRLDAEATLQALQRHLVRALAAGIEQDGHTIQ